MSLALEVAAAFNEAAHANGLKRETAIIASNS